MERDEQAHQAQYRKMLHRVPGLYLVLTRSLHIVDASDAYLRATMTERDEIVGRDIFEVFPDNPKTLSPDGVANLRASLERVLASKFADSMAVQKYDVRDPKSPDGAFVERFWEPLNTPILGADGEVEYIIHAVVDVTEFVNLKRGESEHFKLHAALRAQITERERAEDALRRSEEQLRQAQKLEAIGRLAGGIAHDFNNLLSVVLSYAGMLLMDLGPEDSKREDIEQIQLAGIRAADLTRQLLAFSRQQVLKPETLNVNEIVLNVKSMLRRVLGEDIELRTQLMPVVGRVHADRGQIEQVLMNLAVNSRDAMPDGGVLVIETSEHEVQANEEQAFGLSTGHYVEISVRDTGVGMDAPTQARIFEPFFTTKDRGKGTGLGLSTVFGIVKQSGGSVAVASEPGAGAELKIFLPRYDGVTTVRSIVPAARRLTGDETILLVEDEDQVRVVAAEILRKYGYRVLAARTPSEAFKFCEDQREPIHMLLTDVVMPRMNGLELSRRVHALRPTTKIVFMSGYTDNVISQQIHGEHHVELLRKPFTPEDLATRVREVFDAPGFVDQPQGRQPSHDNPRH